MNNNYTISHYIATIANQLMQIFSDKTLCQQYAWWILQAICNKNKTELLSQPILMLSPEQQNKIELWIHEIVHNKKPLQYLLGSVPFLNLDILVEPPILIPRPETEEWCLSIIEHLQLLNYKKLSILDIATGSGCIALALAAELPQATVIGIDISPTALELAEKNREHNTVHNISFMHSDLFESIPCGAKFDMIVSNPPYISIDEFNQLDESVARWEDYNALVAPENGLAIIKEIIAHAPQFIQTNDEMRTKNIPQLVIEIGYKQGEMVKNMMQDAGYNNILIHRDLSGQDRFVSARADNIYFKSSLIG